MTEASILEKKMIKRTRKRRRGGVKKGKGKEREKYDEEEKHMLIGWTLEREVKEDKGRREEGESLTNIMVRKRALCGVHTGMTDVPVII